jgi:hypothetical protein
MFQKTLTHIQDGRVVINIKNRYHCNYLQPTNNSLYLHSARK